MARMETAMNPGGPGWVAAAFRALSLVGTHSPPSEHEVSPISFSGHNIQYVPMALTTQLGFGSGGTAGDNLSELV